MAMRTVAIVDTKMRVVVRVEQSIIAGQPIGVDDAFTFQLACHDRWQAGISVISNDPRIYFSLVCNKAKDSSLKLSAESAFACPHRA